MFKEKYKSRSYLVGAIVYMGVDVMVSIIFVITDTGGTNKYQVNKANLPTNIANYER